MKRIILILIFIIPIISYSQIKDLKNVFKIYDLNNNQIDSFLIEKKFKQIFHGDAVLEGKIRPYFVYGFNSESERIYIYFTSRNFEEIYKIDFVTISKEIMLPYKDQLNNLNELKKKYSIEFIDKNYPEITIKRKKK